MEEIAKIKEELANIKARLKKLEDTLVKNEPEDELLKKAEEIVSKYEEVSASLLQRRLAIGYARAARILDLLEEKGILGSGEGSKPRKVLSLT